MSTNNTLKNLDAGLAQSRLIEANRLQTVRTETALLVQDGVTGISLSVILVNGNYNINATVGPVIYQLAKNADAGTAAQSLRDAAANHISLGEFTVALLAVAELLTREG